MAIDWSAVWDAALAAGENVVVKQAPTARKFVRQIMQAREQRLKLLMIAWADGALDEETLEAELEEEREILEMEFLALQVLAKKTAQDAVNAVFKVITDALVQGIELVL